MRGALGSAAALCLIWATACGTSTPPAGVIRLGVDLPLTGPEGRAATQVLNGVRFFVGQHPRIDGFEIALTVSDDAAGGSPDPQRGGAALNRFIADRSLLAVIGPFDSAVARVEIPLANVAGLAMISPATTSACLTKDAYLPAGLNPLRTAITCKDAGVAAAAELRPAGVNNFFRLATTDDLQGAAAADYAFKTLHVLRAAVVSDHEAYGQALADSFTARFQRLGGSVVGHLDLDPKGASDTAGFLKAMKADSATAVYYGGATAAQGCTVRSQMTGVFDPGEASPFLSGDGIADDPACVAQAGSNVAGIFATVPAVLSAGSAQATQTVAAFKASYGRTDDYGPYTLLAIDATAVAYAAVDRAIRAAGGQAPLRGSVVSQLSATSGFQGATGVIGFDPAGDTTNRVVSILQPEGTDPGAAWTVVGAVDYSNTLPY